MRVFAGCFDTYIVCDSLGVSFHVRPEFVIVRRDLLCVFLQVALTLK